VHHARAVIRGAVGASTADGGRRTADGGRRIGDPRSVRLRHAGWPGERAFRHHRREVRRLRLPGVAGMDVPHQSPVLALHFTMRATMSSRARTVVCYDKPGCGLSDEWPGRPTLDRDVTVLQAVVNHLELKDFDLLGIAVGAPRLAGIRRPASDPGQAPGRVRRLRRRPADRIGAGPFGDARRGSGPIGDSVQTCSLLADRRVRTGAGRDHTPLPPEIW
jgi:hypothetical protein